ncbi:MAG: hypothetical protein M3680_29170 [Myxococcota bacterium]|nr:hypothetical protein [Myxococcota bacterium]
MLGGDDTDDGDDGDDDDDDDDGDDDDDDDDDDSDVEAWNNPVQALRSTSAGATNGRRWFMRRILPSRRILASVVTALAESICRRPHSIRRRCTRRYAAAGRAGETAVGSATRSRRLVTRGTRPALGSTWSGGAARLAIDRYGSRQ